MKRLKTSLNLMQSLNSSHQYPPVSTITYINLYFYGFSSTVKPFSLCIFYFKNSTSAFNNTEQMFPCSFSVQKCVTLLLCHYFPFISLYSTHRSSPPVTATAVPSSPPLEPDWYLLCQLQYC